MVAASNPGCPQSLAARVAGILSSTLVRERQKYSSADPDIKNEIALRKVLVSLKGNARFWALQFMRRRALEIWEPLLGPNHPKIVFLRDSLVRRRQVRVVDVDVDVDSDFSEDLLAELADHEPFDLSEVDQTSTLKPIADLLDLGDAPPDCLLNRLQVVESSSVSGKEVRQSLALLRIGRSGALLGVYYSFICRFEEAERAFQTSERYMENETCVEIRLYRMLWYAEHKTRVGDWEGVRRLMCGAHNIFIATDGLSEFVLNHFPDRFTRLCSAVMEKLPIDCIIDQAPIPNAYEHNESAPQSAVTPFPCTSALPESSAAADSGLSPSRLFPSTPGGINAEIDINAWREFVQFSPTRSEPSPRVTPVDYPSLEINHLIIPTSNTRRPVAPNFFLEAKDPEGGAGVAKWQAGYGGAIGARAMHALRRPSRGFSSTKGRTSRLRTNMDGRH
jgi:hypothetical protein